MYSAFIIYEYMHRCSVVHCKYAFYPLTKRLAKFSVKIWKGTGLEEEEENHQDIKAFHHLDLIIRVNHEFHMNY